MRICIMLMQIHNTAVFLNADPVDNGRIVFGLSLELLVFMYQSVLQKSWNELILQLEIFADNLFIYADSFHVI